MRFPVPAVLVVLLSVGATAPAQDEEPAPPGEAPFTVVPEEASLEIGGRRVPATRVATPRREFTAGSLRIEMEGPALKAFRGPEGEPAWEAKAEGADEIEVLEDSAARLLCRWWKRTEEDEWECLGGAGTLRPLALSDGKWGRPLVLGRGGKKELDEGERIGTVREGVEGTAVLSVVYGETINIEPSLASWRVTFFPAGETEAAWSLAEKSPRSFPSAAWMRGDAGGYHRSDVRRLSFIGGRLVVCAGPLQDLLVVSTKDGSVQARLERAWEFRPGQPSPPALPTPGSPYREERPESAPTGEEESGPTPRSRILAGPVAVPHREVGEMIESPTDSFRVFLVTAVDSGEIDGYALDPYLLELDASLHPVAMSALPRIVAETLEIPGSPSADFRLDGGGVLRVTPSFQVEIHGSKEMGTGRRVRISLLHEPAPVFRTAYMTTGGVQAFHADSRGVLATTVGGFIESPDSAEILLPFESFSFGQGGEVPCQLRIPLRGPIPLPETNYGISYPGGDKKAQRVVAKDPHIAVITGFRRLGDTLGVQAWVRGRGRLWIEFDMAGR